MTETFICGDHQALVSYLYDECAPDARRAISAHVAICGACAEELTALGATREQLLLWTPPEAQLGFRIVSEPAHAKVLRPARWWNRSMPAWAQAAAAAAIFATGIGLGMVRGTIGGPDRSAPREASSVSSSADAAGPGRVTRADLVALEQKLRAELTPRATQVAASAPAEARMLDRVRAMIDESEQRQRRELALRTTEMVRDFDAQRNDDLVRIERTLGQMDTGPEIAQQRQMINYLMRVSSQRGQ